MVLCAMPSFVLLLSFYLCLYSFQVQGSSTHHHQDDTTEHPTDAKEQQQPYRPHVLMIVMDDLGSHDLGMHQSGILTPTADQLAAQGVYLDRYYVLPYCSPTRAALLSGRYPQHTGCHSIILDNQTQGLPLTEETLPTVLRKVGYQAHAVGKWHLGHAQWEQTPTFRGFQSFFGFYLSGQDYETHIKSSGQLGSYYDLHWDSTEYCGQGCSKLVDERGNYSTHVFTREAIRVIQDHAAASANKKEENPLFLYLAHQAVHAPDEVPQQYRDYYVNRTSDWSYQRITYAGMLTAADESLSAVIAELKLQDMWKDTLVVYTTDNGGPTDVCLVQGASNGSRLGGKCTVYQGGTTGDAILSGPALKRLGILSKSEDDTSDDSSSSNPNQNAYTGLVHVVDWLPTLAAVTGAPLEGKPLDGLNQLDALRGSAKPPRQEVFVGYAAYENSWYGPAIVQEDGWKLIQGQSGGPLAADYFVPGTSQPATGGCNASDYLLYHVLQDPTESTNLAKRHPDVVQRLCKRLEEYQTTYQPPPVDNDPLCGDFPGLVNDTTLGPVWLPWCHANVKQIVVAS